MQTLTKPQADFLLRAMRHGAASASRHTWRVGHGLVAKGYMKQHEHDATFMPTRLGLEALGDYWMRKDAASGCMAYRLTREEVEAELALVSA